MKKHHVRHHNNHKPHNGEEGFFSVQFKELMNRNDRIIIILIATGIVVLLGLSIYLVVTRTTSDDEELVATISPTPQMRITTPYPTIPKEIKDTTVMINRRAFLPPTVTIKVGGSVGFFNNDEIEVTVEAADRQSEILNIGPVAPLDVPVVVFDAVGVYRYQNAADPTVSAEIIVEE